MLREQISDAYKVAMKSGDKPAVATLRLIQAALKDRDIAARTKGVSDGVDEEEILDMLQKMVRQRRDSIEMYEQGGRLELAEREQGEIDIIEGFLPRQMDDTEIEEAVGAVMSETGASSLKDMGRVMGLVKERYSGRMDFAKASAQVKARLASG